MGRTGRVSPSATSAGGWWPRICSLQAVDASGLSASHQTSGSGSPGEGLAFSSKLSSRVSLVRPRAEALASQLGKGEHSPGRCKDNVMPTDSLGSGSRASHIWSEIQSQEP